MKVNDVLTLIDSLTSYIAYFYPGYITIYIFRFLKAKTMKDNKINAVKSVVISFIYNVCLKHYIAKENILYHLILLTISLLVPYLCYKAQACKLVNKAFDFLGIRVRFEDNAIDILDTEEISPWLRVYLKNDTIVYEGFLGEKELEEGTNQFITLKKFKKYILDDNKRPKKPYLEEKQTDSDMVLIFYDEIKNIEKINILNEEG